MLSTIDAASSHRSTADIADSITCIAETCKETESEWLIVCGTIALSWQPPSWARRLQGRGGALTG